MKKYCALLLAFLLLCLPLSAWAEGDQTPPPPPPEPEYEPLPEEYLPLYQRALGTWFADYAGLEMKLTLSEDGAYALLIPGAPEQAGTWAEKDGQLLLDGDEENAVLVLDEALRLDALGLLFTREKPETYVPGDLLSDVKEGSFDGYWKAQFMAVGDGVILAQAMDEDAKLYIEGRKAALGGKRFGSVIRDFAFENGTLTLKEGDATVTLALQSDGFLRLTVDGNEPATVYLMAAPVPDRPAGTP